MHTRADTKDGPLVLEVERFEHEAAGAERVLLRIDGRYGDRPGTRVLDAMLFVDDGLAVHRHPALTTDEPDVDSWLWRAAFDVPAAYLTDERTRFAIESQPGCLVDLPRPSAVSRGAAVAITARAAHTARRYAVAIAALVAVAVTPGGLPASARTEILRVHQPDGSVIYLTTDGQQISQLPPDAVIIDQAAPAPAPEPAPESQPADDPAPQSAPQHAPAAGTKQQGGSPSGLADATRAQRTTRSPAGATQQRKQTKRPEGRPQTAPPADPDARPAAVSSLSEIGEPEPRKRDRRRRGRPGRDLSDLTPLITPPRAHDDLHAMPELLAAPGSDDATLQPLGRVEQSSTGRVVRSPEAPLPTKDFESLPTLAGGPGHGASVGLPDGELPDEDAPPLIPIVPDEPPTSEDGERQERSGDDRRAERKKRDRKRRAEERDERRNGGARPEQPAPAPLRNSDGTPTRSNPTYFDALPGPARPGAVPDFVIEKFRVPPFLLPIYQAAGIQYGIRWEILAAINEIETDYGRNLNVSSAGALGWMQFMPATWDMYGTDANRDGKADPYNPVDAIFSAARYLKAAGGHKDLRAAIWAYNHADWYVDSVLLRARVIAGYPADLVGSLTGLTEGRFPVAARSRYADDVRERGLEADDRGIEIFTRKGAPAVAVNDGVIKKIGHSKEHGNYVVLQDVYGNQYTYSGLGSVSKLHPVPRDEAKRNPHADVEIVGAQDPKPKSAASEGTQRTDADAPKPKAAPKRKHKHVHGHEGAPGQRVVAVKQRLFAHPDRPQSRKHGGSEQLLERRDTGSFETYDSYFSRPLGLNSRNATLRPLKVGSRVVASTVLGRVGDGGEGKAPHLRFEIRPAGKGAPKIDPKPILDGWKLLESTAIYRASGKNALYGDGDFSVGELMLLPKNLLAKRILSDPRVELYAGGREDIRTGQIDRRVLVTIAYLAESGLHPTISSLKAGRRSLYTASGNLSAHPTGNAVDISAINGVPINGHQGAGDVTEQAVRRLMMLQGTLQPNQIISLLDFGGNTLAMGDHADHIHVGFQPLFGDNEELGREAGSVLQPRQWDDLVERLGEIPNPTVPTKPSRYATPTGEHGDE